MSTKNKKAEFLMNAPFQIISKDEELREVIKKILDGANLEEVTMKTVCKQVRPPPVSTI